MCLNKPASIFFICNWATCGYRYHTVIVVKRMPRLFVLRVELSNSYDLQIRRLNAYPSSSVRRSTNLRPYKHLYTKSLLYSLMQPLGDYCTSQFLTRCRHQDSLFYLVGCYTCSGCQDCRTNWLALVQQHARERRRPTSKQGTTKTAPVGVAC